MQITTEMIKDLRQMTGAGVLEAKRRWKMPTAILTRL